MADTGQGAILALATTGVFGVIRSITSPEFTIDKIEDSDLTTTTFKTYISTDLKEPGEVSAEIVFDSTANTVPSLGVAETVTLTWPLHTSGNSTKAKIIGTGFITAYKVNDFTMGELQVATITVAFDGKTDPAFTGES